MDVYDLARKQFPKRVAETLERLRKSEPACTYEQALREAAKQDPELYNAYSRSVASD